MSDTKNRASVMTQSYGVRELADLREAVERKFHFDSYLPMMELFQITGSRHMSGRASFPGEAAANIEEQTRTHMMAGHTAEMLMEDERRSRTKTAA